MTTYKEMEKRFKDLSELSIVDRYFKSGRFVSLTERFCKEFGPFIKEEKHDALISVPINKEASDTISASYVGKFYYFSTLKDVFSKFEKKVKKELFSGFVDLLNDLTREAEKNRKVEVDQLRTEKERQIKELEKQIETMQKSNDSSSTFEWLYSEQAATEDCFLVGRNSQNFEPVKNNSSVLPFGNSNSGS